MATKTKSASPPQVEYATAMDKIRDEMAKSKDNYVQVVGEYLTDYLLAHPEVEAALLDKGKSIKGSLETVRKEAEKVKQGNMAILDDRTVFGIVLGYFGIKGEPDVLKTEPDVLRTGENVLKTGENVLKTPGDAVADMASQHVGEIAAAMERHSERLRRGEITDRHPDYDDTPADPFDLDALLGGVL